MARAHAIDTRLEKLIPAMEEYHLMGVLTKEECHAVIKDRTFHEYRLVAKPLLFIDVENAVKCELAIEAKIAAFCKLHDGKKKPGSDKNAKPTEKVKLRHRWDIQERIEKIYLIGLKHLKNRAEREELRTMFVKQMIEFKRTASLSKQYALWLTLAPSRGDLWAEAALFEASGKHQHGTKSSGDASKGLVALPSRGTVAGRIEEARSIIQHAISTVPQSEAVWLAALTIELNFAQTLLHTTAVEAVESGDSDPIASIEGPKAPEQERAMAAIMFDLALVKAVVEWAATTSVGGIVRDDEEEDGGEEGVEGLSGAGVGAKRARESVVQSLERPALSPKVAIAMFELLLQYQFAAELAPFVIFKALESYVAFLAKTSTSNAAHLSRKVIEQDIQCLLNCALAAEERITRRNCADARTYLTEQVTKELQLLQEGKKRGEGAAQASLLHKGFFRKRKQVTVAERRTLALKTVAVGAILLMRHLEDGDGVGIHKATVYTTIHNASRNAIVEALKTVVVTEESSRGALVIDEFQSDDPHHDNQQAAKSATTLPLFTPTQRSAIVARLAGGDMPRIAVPAHSSASSEDAASSIDVILGHSQQTISHAAFSAFLRSVLVSGLTSDDGRPGNVDEIERCLEASLNQAAAASATLDGTMDQLVHLQQNKSSSLTSKGNATRGADKASFSTHGIFVEDYDVAVASEAANATESEDSVWSSDLLASLMLPADYRALKGDADSAAATSTAGNSVLSATNQEVLVRTLVSVDCKASTDAKLDVMVDYLSALAGELSAKSDCSLPPMEVWKLLAAAYVLCSNKVRSIRATSTSLSTPNHHKKKRADEVNDSSDDEGDDRIVRASMKAVGRGVMVRSLNNVADACRRIIAMDATTTNGALAEKELLNLFGNALSFFTNLHSHVNTTAQKASVATDEAALQYNKGFYTLLALYIRDVLQLPHNDVSSCHGAVFHRDHVEPVASFLKSATSSPQSIRNLVSQLEASLGGQKLSNFPLSGIVESTRAPKPNDARVTPLHTGLADLLPSVVHRAVLRELVVPCAMIQSTIRHHNSFSTPASRRELSLVLDLLTQLYNVQGEGDPLKRSRYLKQVRSSVFTDFEGNESVSEADIHKMQIDDWLLRIDAELYICKSPASSKNASSAALKQVLSPKLLLAALQARQNI